MVSGYCKIPVKINAKQILFNIIKLGNYLNSSRNHLNFGIQDATKRSLDSYMLHAH